MPFLPHVPRSHYPNNFTIFLQTPHVVYCTFNCRSIVLKCQSITSDLLPLTTKHSFSLNALYFRVLKGLQLYLIADSVYLIWGLYDVPKFGLINSESSDSSFITMLVGLQKNRGLNSCSNIDFLFFSVSKTPTS
jgi:hypothetical protein